MEEPSRYDRLTNAVPMLSVKVKHLIEEYIGRHEIADVAFDLEKIGDGFMTIHVDFYDEPKDGEISPAIDNHRKV